MSSSCKGARRGGYANSLLSMLGDIPTASAAVAVPGNPDQGRAVVSHDHRLHSAHIAGGRRFSDACMEYQDGTDSDTFGNAAGNDFNGLEDDFDPPLHVPVDPPLDSHDTRSPYASGLLETYGLNPSDLWREEPGDGGEAMQGVWMNSSVCVMVSRWLALLKNKFTTWTDT